MRYWEIDFLRGVAIIMMIVFHVLFDLNYFSNYEINIHYGFWWAFARITASIFIFLVGISLTLSYSRAVKKRKNLLLKYLYRCTKIFSWGLIITLVTWIFIRQGFIVFGVLHFIGLSIIIAYFFLRFRLLNLFLGVIFILIGIYLQGFVFSFPYLLWLGLMPQNFYTLDYFPLLPWFGLVLLGLFFGKLLYPEGKRRIKIREVRNPVTRLFCFLGRHSLLLYLVHQPVLIAILYVFIL
jgi:uncharacterized membrane protein